MSVRYLKINNSIPNNMRRNIRLVYCRALKQHFLRYFFHIRVLHSLAISDFHMEDTCSKSCSIVCEKKGMLPS